FLDIVLSLGIPGYLEWLQRYRQVLLRRNALLRDGAPPSLVAAWDAGLAEWGGRVMASRQAWIGEREDTFREHVARIGGGTVSRLDYVASAHAGESEPGASDARAALLEALERSRERERRRGMTVVGPHRDNLRLRVRAEGSDGWTDLRAYGSGGQQRTAAIALRM